MTKDGKEKGTFCAIGDTVDVRVGSQYMTIRFTAAAVGTFDCVAIVGETTKALDRLIPEFSQCIHQETYSSVACKGKAVTHGPMGIDGKETGELDSRGNLTKDQNGEPYPI
jgi:hypothetical protein